jgi:hypothetical protein
MPLSTVAIGAGITVASAAVAKAKTKAILEQIILVFMLASPDSQLNPDPFSPRIGLSGSYLGNMPTGGKFLTSRVMRRELRHIFTDSSEADSHVFEIWNV